MTAFAALPGGDGVPPEPEWSEIFDDVLEQALAHETWGLVVREMRGAETLTVANGHAIKRLCIAAVLYERSARDVAEHGSVIRAKKSGVLQYSPHFVVARQMGEDIKTLEMHLGISPIGRRKVAKAPKAKDGAARPSDTYLKREPK